MAVAAAVVAVVVVVVIVLTKLPVFHAVTEEGTFILSSRN